MKNSFSTLLAPSLLAATGLAIASSTLTATPAQAIQLSFSNISHNKVADAAIGEAQLFVNVTDASGTENPFATQALFSFSNIGPAASSITRVYFDDGRNSVLSGIAQIFNGSGVSFSAGAKPPNLPAGQNISFSTDFSAGSNSPVQPNGVNPGESLGILFNLQNGSNLQSVINQLASSDLRVGIHVQGFAGGGSESFVNNKPQPVPEPGTMAATGLIVAGYGLLKKKVLKRGV